MAFRLGDYPRGAEIHLDYMTATWRANGVRLPVILPADKSVHTWRMEYDPDVTIDPKWPANVEQHFQGGREKEEDLYQRALKSEAGLTREDFRKLRDQAYDTDTVVA